MFKERIIGTYAEKCVVIRKHEYVYTPNADGLYLANSYSTKSVCSSVYGLAAERKGWVGAPEGNIHDALRRAVRKVTALEGVA